MGTTRHVTDAIEQIQTSDGTLRDLNVKYVDGQIPNMENGSTTGSVQMKAQSDKLDANGKFKFGTMSSPKNANAVSLDTTFYTTDSSGNILIPYGATSQSYAAAFGGCASAQGKRSLAEGTSTVAKGPYSHAEGDNSVALGADSHAEGSTTTAYGDRSHAEGYNTLSKSFNSHAEGNTTQALGQSSHAEGSTNIAEGEASHSEGVNTHAKGYASHAEGDTSKATADYAHAEGFYTNATGLKAHAEGGENTASGECAHAEGDKTKSSMQSSHAEGSGTEATGDYAHSEGYYSTSSGKGAHAEGYKTKASGAYSHAEGYNTTASGEYSHAGGEGSTAGGKRSFAHGNTCTVNTNALNGVAFGYNTSVANNNEVAIGQFNSTYTNSAGGGVNPMFTVGIGTSTTDKKNAFTILSDGRAKVQSKPKDDDDVIRLQEVLKPLATTDFYDKQLIGFIDGQTVLTPSVSLHYLVVGLTGAATFVLDGVYYIIDVTSGSKTYTSEKKYQKIGKYTYKLHWQFYVAADKSSISNINLIVDEISFRLRDYVAAESYDVYLKNSYSLTNASFDDETGIMTIKGFSNNLMYRYLQSIASTKTYSGTIPSTCYVTTQSLASTKGVVVPILVFPDKPRIASDLASTTNIGGVKLGYSENKRNYALQLNSSNKAYVNVPWQMTEIYNPTTDKEGQTWDNRQGGFGNVATISGGSYGAICIVSATPETAGSYLVISSSTTAPTISNSDDSTVYAVLSTHTLSTMETLICPIPANSTYYLWSFGYWHYGRINLFKLG